ncbi:MAG: ZIP family metal transporter [Parcubacteria group bacterium]|nr:ZIP family metal transporter [Parcubacteria group bacterium]MCR4342912.1 ZIP family metal transporter [Patescibacteria group bacterium]
MLLFWILGASAAQSIVALIGQVIVFLFKKNVTKYINYLVSFSVGTLLGVIFFDILPEALEESSSGFVFAYVLAGFLAFFALTRVLSWSHCHTADCHIHNTREGVKVLLGDAIHNFIDGIIIALAFLVDFNLGIVTTLAVLVHEAPMEISDFFILIHAGYSVRKALFYNFLIALTTIAGSLLAYFAAPKVDSLIIPALGIVAGNFLYIAASDLIPELHDGEGSRGKISSALQMFLIVFGILIIYFSSSILG